MCGRVIWMDCVGNRKCALILACRLRWIFNSMNINQSSNTHLPTQWIIKGVSSSKHTPTHAHKNILTRLHEALLLHFVFTLAADCRGLVRKEPVHRFVHLLAPARNHRDYYDLKKGSRKVNSIARVTHGGARRRRSLARLHRAPTRADQSSTDI